MPRNEGAYSPILSRVIKQQCIPIIKATPVIRLIRKGTRIFAPILQGWTLLVSFLHNLMELNWPTWWHSYQSQRMLPSNSSFATDFRDNTIRLHDTYISDIQ